LEFPKLSVKVRFLSGAQKFKNFILIFDFLILFWAHGSAGRAPPWHGGGQEFESPWVHPVPNFTTLSIVIQILRVILIYHTVLRNLERGGICWTKSELFLTKIQTLIDAKLRNNFAGGSRAKIFLPLNPSNVCPLAKNFYKIFFCRFYKSSEVFTIYLSQRTFNIFKFWICYLGVNLGCSNILMTQKLLHISDINDIF
jgi:hypothetical protein